MSKTASEKVASKKIPCMQAYLDNDGYFACSGFSPIKTDDWEISLCCDDCVHRGKFCPACQNFTKEEDSRDPYQGFCSVNQECKKQTVSCGNFTLRLFETKEDMEEYNGLKTE